MIILTVGVSLIALSTVPPLWRLGEKVQRWWVAFTGPVSVDLWARSVGMDIPVLREKVVKWSRWVYLGGGFICSVIGVAQLVGLTPSK